MSTTHLWPKGLKRTPRTIVGATVIVVAMIAFFRLLSGVPNVFRSNGQSRAQACLTADLAEAAGTQDTIAQTLCDSPGIPWGTIGLVLLAIIALSSLVFFIRRRIGKEKAGEGKTAEGKIVRWISSIVTLGGVLKITILYGLLNLLAFILWPDKYGTWMYQMWFWQMQGGIVIVAILLALMSDTKTKVIGSIGALILGIWIVSVGWKWGSEEFKKRTSGTTTTATPTPTTGTPSGASASWDWASINGPEKDTVMAAFPGDTVMWKIAAAESDYTQFRVDSNGDSSIVQNKDGFDAYGIFQIRKSVWDNWCKERGFDIMKTHGNIGCAKAIKAKYPKGNPWLASAHLWRDSTTVDPCAQYARYGGVSMLDFVRKDTVITTGDVDFTRRIMTENMVVDWVSVNFRTDYVVRYGYLDPITNQIVVAEDTIEKEKCPEDNRLPRYPLWVEFKSLDADPIMIEITFSKDKRTRQ